MGLGRQIPDAIAGLDVGFSRIIAVIAEPLHRPGKLLYLSLSEGPVLLLETVRHTQMGKYSLNVQIRQVVQPNQGLPVRRRNAQTVHPGVQSQMDGEGHPLSGQSLSMHLIGHRLGELPLAEPVDLLQGRVPQNENFPLESHLAQVNTLLQTGHREGPHSLLFEAPDHRVYPVAVGVRLHYRHQAAARSERPLQHLGVVGQRVQIDRPPGPAFPLIHRSPPVSKCGAAGPPPYSRLECPGG